MTTQASVYWLHLPEHTDPFTEGYVGVSTNLKQRLRYHRNAGKSGRHQNNYISHVYQQKKGHIKESVLLIGLEDYCYEIELKMRPKESVGWNFVKGGGKPPLNNTPEQNERRSQKLKGRVITQDHINKLIEFNSGVIFSEERKNKIREKAIGRILSEESNLKRSRSLKGRIPWNKGITWKKKRIINAS